MGYGCGGGCDCGYYNSSFIIFLILILLILGMMPYGCYGVEDKK